MAAPLLLLDPPAPGGGRGMNLDRVRAALGRAVLYVPASDPRPVTGRAAVWRPGLDTPRPGPGDLVLAVGAALTPPRLAELLEQAAAAGAAAVLLRGAAPPAVLRAEVARCGVAVLAAEPTAGWDHTHRLLAAAGAGDPAVSDPARLGRRGRAYAALTGSGTADLPPSRLVGLRPPVPWPADSVEALALRTELAGLTAGDGAEVACLGGGVVVVGPAARFARARAGAVAAHGAAFAASRLGVAVAAVVEDREVPVERLAAAAADLDGSLAALAGGRIATVRELVPAVVLARLRTIARTHPELLSGRLDGLRALDAGRRTEYLRTLGAYFDAAGDPATAAAALYVHPNTVRYRLRRIQELSGLDLSDPLERLVAELQLRLGPAAPERR